MESKNGVTLTFYQAFLNHKHVKINDLQGFKFQRVTDLLNVFLMIA
jgi:hypothetical protein